MLKQKFRTVITLAMIASMVLVLFTGCGQPKKDAAPQPAAPQSAQEAYEAFIQDQKEAGNKEEIYAAITTTSEDGSQVLLIADEETGFENQAIKADIYTFADGQVIKICDIESTGTAYPIGSVDGKFLVAGSHHTVKCYLVSGNAAYVQILDGYAMEDANYKMTTYTVANDEISDVEESNIDEAQADEFATAIYEGWEPLEFTKY